MRCVTSLAPGHQSTALSSNRVARVGSVGLQSDCAACDRFPTHLRDCRSPSHDCDACHDFRASQSTSSKTRMKCPSYFTRSQRTAANVYPRQTGPPHHFSVIHLLFTMPATKHVAAHAGVPGAPAIGVTGWRCPRLPGGAQLRDFLFEDGHPES